MNGLQHSRRRALISSHLANRRHSTNQQVTYREQIQLSWITVQILFQRRLKLNLHFAVNM